MIIPLNNIWTYGLSFAVKSDNDDWAYYMIIKGADPTEYIRKLAKNGDLEGLQIILEYLIEQQQKGKAEHDYVSTALVYAAGEGKMDMVKYFLTLPQIDNEWVPGAITGAIAFAEQGNHEEVVRLLQEYHRRKYPPGAQRRI